MKLWVITEVKFTRDPDATPDEFLNIVHAVATSPGNVGAIMRELRTKIAPKNKKTAPIRSIPAMGSVGWVCEFTGQHYLRALPAEPDQIISYQSGPAEDKAPEQVGVPEWSL